MTATETPAEASTAAERDGRPLVHSHVGQQQPHVHTAETLRDHRRPIVGERVYARLPEPGSAPAAWHAGPYEAASVLRSWAEYIAGGHGLSDHQRERLAHELRGAASVLDGTSAG